ncbi:hypothetical protein VNI00_013117 [Paramarasmius palmivorus]|uniref:Uncharacterized protein n=1 Tax=Paramarasmius palmivorus TaxID=297713 RepID=A0AAW0B3V5_9AGAR
MADTNSAPSLDEVLAHLKKQLGPNPTAKSISVVVKELPDSYRDVLLSKPVDQPVLDDDQKKAAAIEVAKELSNDENAELLKEAADAAATAVKKLQEMFISLESKLSSIDTQHKDKPFLPDLQNLHKRYNVLVQSSKDIATEIAAYGTQFDTVVVKFCADQSLSTEDRKEVIDKFIKEADRFKEEADTLNTNFKELHTDFAEFKGKFTHWAENKEKEIEKEIEQATKELKALEKQLSNLMWGVVGCLGGGLLSSFGAAYAAIYLLPAYSTSIIVGALIVLGVSMVVALVLAVKIFAVTSEISAKKKKIEDLQKTVGEIRASRSELEEAGTSALVAWNDGISAISHLWQSVQHDAVEIKSWLKQGANMAKVPKYMKDCLDHDVGVYNKMAVYLDQYASSA